MVIRGAPAIGCAAALGVALAADRAAAQGPDAVVHAVREAAELLATTRPTAVNLFWALERMRSKTAAARASSDSGRALARALLDEARRIIDEDVASNRALGRYGAELLPATGTVLTHCNAGALATGGYGTALGVIRAAVEQGKRIAVLADETRPWLQGARLTAWELHRDGIDVTVITESMAGALMRGGRVDAAVVGADRIAANGDVANKIGTYTVAVLCRHHHVPFYVAAPTSTIDLATPTGEEIPIEERPHEEVAIIGGTRFVPEGVPVRNIAFDVTPAELVDAIVTERGVARAPYRESLAALVAPR
jgi:methylthioribose-1-phosphate isomerase